MLEIKSGFSLDNIKTAKNIFKENENLKADMCQAKKDFPNMSELEQAIEVAINHARQDLMVRTLTPNPENPEKFCDEEFKKYKNELKKYFKSSRVKDRKSYNKWHNERCKDVRAKLSCYYVGVKYGKAQKMVNMTMKYLYCIISDKEKYFKYCHMPLDSIMLEWIKREMKEIEPQFRISKIPTWSNLEDSSSKTLEDVNSLDDIEDWKELEDSNKQYYTYQALVLFVDKILKDKKINPLRAEFVIWHRMRIKLAAEEFIKQLEIETKNSEEEKRDPKNASLEENLEFILDTIK